MPSPPSSSEGAGSSDRPRGTVLDRLPPRLRVALPWIAGGVLLAAFISLRCLHPWTFDYESEEYTIHSAAFLQNGILLESPQRIRYLMLVVGPLYMYLKSVPYLFTPDPGGEILFVILLHGLAAALLSLWVWRRFGLRYALTSLFLLVFSSQSISRSVNPHPRSYSIPLVVILMIVVERVLVQSEHRRLMLLAAVFAFATQVYGFATVLLPPGILILFLLYRPRIPARDWIGPGIVFGLLQLPSVPFILRYDLVREIPRAIVNGTFLMPEELGDLAANRFEALGAIAQVSSETFIELVPSLALAIGFAALILDARRTIVAGQPWRRSPSVFLLLWFVGFLVLPQFAGVGNRTHLGQFLGPVISAIGLVRTAEWLRKRVSRRWRAVFRGCVAAGALGVAGLLLTAFWSPWHLPLLADPGARGRLHPMPSLDEVRGAMRSLHDRGLGRVAFNERVHGAMVFSDEFGDSYLFWLACSRDPVTPCSTDASGLPPDAHFLVYDTLFPSGAGADSNTVFQPADVVWSSDAGRFHVAEVRSRILTSLRAASFRSDEEGGGPDDRVPEGPAGALRTPDLRPAPWTPEQLGFLPEAGPGAGVPALSIRRRSPRGRALRELDLDPTRSFETDELDRQPTLLDVVFQGSFTLDRLPPPGQELHVGLSTERDNGQCRMDVFLDGRAIPARELIDPRAGDQALPLELDVDLTPYLAVGTHVVAIRMTRCSARLYDFYDVVVSRK